MFPPRRRYHHNLQATDGLTALASWLDIVAILIHYQPSYNTSHTMKLSDPLLFADVTLSCGIYPDGKVDISRHLAILGFPQGDHTFGDFVVVLMTPSESRGCQIICQSFDRPLDRHVFYGIMYR